MPLKEKAISQHEGIKIIVLTNVCPFPSHSSQAKHKRQKWFYAFKGLHTRLERHLNS